MAQHRLRQWLWCPGGEKPGQSTALNAPGLGEGEQDRPGGNRRPLKLSESKTIVPATVPRKEWKNHSVRGKTKEGEFQAWGQRAHSEGNWETPYNFGETQESVLSPYGAERREVVEGRPMGKGRPGPFAD